MSSSFASIPNIIKSHPTPFQVSIPQEQVEEFQQLLSLSKIGPKTYENEQPDARLGLTREWLANAKSEWLKWDWRSCEERINSFPNFTLPIKDQGDVFTIHFAALFSQRQDAIPILLLHGWPGSFMEFFSIMKILSEKYTPENMPYHIVVPSLPGYAFSTPPPLTRDFQFQDVGRIMNSLMSELGFGSGYVVQGGDLGSKIASIMAATYDEIKAIHLNCCIITRPDGVNEADYSALEREGLERGNEFKQLGSAYALMHASKPSTIGLVLSASPIALLAWIGEKFLAWTDEDPPLDEILSSVSLYWFTETFPRSIYLYRQLFTPGIVAPDQSASYISKPFGFSWFPKELIPTPRSWAAKTGNLVFFRVNEHGGHFAAMETPDVLLADLEAFIDQVWNE